MNNYEVIIGVEIHLELNTKSKMFSISPNSEGEPNTLFNLYDLGYLGTLPQVNGEAVQKAIALAKALKMQIAPVLAFDRKNYFYPDLPKGFQITQQFQPIGRDGQITVKNKSNNTINNILIERIHLEEDTAKQIHTEDSSFLDYNRCGVPLIEIVTKPVIHSAQMAADYVDSIRKLALFLEISDAKLENGSLRADVNISVRKKGQTTFNPKVEIKNINSISNIKKAAELEIQEQIQIYEQGKIAQQVTKRFDDQSQTNKVLRSKTDAIDYKYFPEPNIPLIEISKEFIDSVETKSTPDQIESLLKQENITDFYIEQILNSVQIWNFLESSKPVNWSTAIKLFFAEIMPIINKIGWQELKIDTIFFDKLVQNLENEKINSSDAKKIVSIKQTENKDFEVIFNEIAGSKLSKEQIEEIINNLFKSEAGQIEKNKDNKDRLLKFLTGKVMQISKGNADPKTVNSILLEKIN